MHDHDQTAAGRPGTPRPALLFYCQHSLGIGHLTRSFALAEALARRFRVVFLNGGRLPEGVAVPAGLECIDLPPLGMDDGHTVVSRDSALDVAAAAAQRRALILEAVARTRPALLLVELFPFGRKKFAGEILPMIRAARRQPGRPARVVCSLRDILVDARPDQQHHDDRARWLADRYFDAVLVHADPAFARLEESFRPRRALRVPVVHTGYVVPGRGRAVAVGGAGSPRVAAEFGEAVPAPATGHGEHLLVSAGGGIVGAPLFDAALDARALLEQRGAGRLPLRIVVGPFLPEPQWQALQRRCAALSEVTLVRHVPDMVAEMRAARASLSQCGYNTALDLVQAGVPALVAPYETRTENEQRQRAERLQALGAMLCLAPGALHAEGLAEALGRLLAFRPRAAALAVDGAARSAQWLDALVQDAVAQPGRAPASAPPSPRAAAGMTPLEAA